MERKIFLKVDGYEITVAKIGTAEQKTEPATARTINPAQAFLETYRALEILCIAISTTRIILNYLPDDRVAADNFLEAVRLANEFVKAHSQLAKALDRG